MKCCVSTDVGTWTNWLTFEPDLVHSPDAGTGLLSPISYRLWNFAALPMLPASCAATRNFTSGKSHVYVRAVVLKWFYSLSRQKTFVGGKCALPSALLAFFFLPSSSFFFFFFFFFLILLRLKVQGGGWPPSFIDFIAFVYWFIVFYCVAYSLFFSITFWWRLSVSH